MSGRSLTTFASLVFW